MPPAGGNPRCYPPADNPTIQTIGTIFLTNPEFPIRFFASSHRVDQLSPRTRLLIALFLFGILGQAVTGILMHHRGPGWTATSISEHYQGRTVNLDALESDELQRALNGDPEFLDRPGKTFDGLLDIAHMHLAFMPMIVFIIAHLFSMAPFAKRAWAGALCYATGIAALVDIAAPFGVRYVSPLCAPAKLVAFIILEFGLITMTVTCLWACLLSLREKNSRSAELATDSDKA